MGIGTVEAVASGQYDEEYLRETETLPISGNNFNVFSRRKKGRENGNRKSGRGKTGKEEKTCPEGKASVPSR
jgi:hypothetical protein